MLYLNIAFGFLIIILIIQFRRLRTVEKYLTMTGAMLFYYRVRFGHVPMEDIENRVGLDKEQIKMVEEFWKQENRE